MELFCVAPHMIDEFWPHAVSFITNAVMRGNGDYTTAHIYRRLQRHQALLWLVVDDNVVKMAGTTEINSLLDGPERVCVITTLAGSNMENYAHFLDEIEQYAISENCSRIRLYGRPGWARYLRDRGYKEPWIALEKRLDG